MRALRNSKLRDLQPWMGRVLLSKWPWLWAADVTREWFDWTTNILKVVPSLKYDTSIGYVNVDTLSIIMYLTVRQKTISKEIYKKNYIPVQRKDRETLTVLYTILLSFEEMLRMFFLATLHIDIIVFE